MKKKSEQPQWFLGSQDWEAWLFASNDDFQSIGTTNSVVSQEDTTPPAEVQLQPLKRALWGQTGPFGGSMSVVK